MKFLEKLKKHKHNWLAIYACRSGQLETCPCGEFRSKLYSYSSKSWEYVNGNFLLSSAKLRTLCVICEDYVDYVNATTLFKHWENSGVSLIRITQPEQLENDYPILLYGNWFLNEEVAHSPQFRRKVNGFLESL